MRRWITIMLPLVVLAAAGYMRVESPVIAHELRLKVFDAYQSIKPRDFKPDETPSRIVDIDEESLRRFGQWPWPRPSLAIGIGLSTRVVCVGNIGLNQRFDYSVLGDDMNLAARLEGQSKTYGVDIVIGANTLAQLTDKATLELDLLQVRGKTKPVRIHCVAGGKDLLEREKFLQLRETHIKMLAAYAGQRWDEAFESLDKGRKEMADVIDLTVLYELYDERLTDFRANPPGEDWDGVFIATSK